MLRHYVKTSKPKTSGFTLVETLVAILVLSLALVSITTLITRTISVSNTSQQNFIAAKIAQEGVELIKAKRNSNIAGGVSPWYKNIAGNVGTAKYWEPDTTQVNAALTDSGSYDALANPASARVLCIRTAPAAQEGKYTYACDPSESRPLLGNYKRYITATRLDNGIDDGEHVYSIEVSVTVIWEGGSVTATTLLFETI